MVCFKLTLLSLSSAIFSVDAFVQQQQKGETFTLPRSSSLTKKRISSSSSSPLFAATTTVEEITNGLYKTITKKGSKNVQLGDIATVKYSCYLPNNPELVPFSKAEEQSISIGDSQMIPGWERSIQTMSVGERAIIRITDPTLGYGNRGIPNLIPPNSEIELDIEILDSKKPEVNNFDFDSFDVDNIPSTPEDIAAAYEISKKKLALERGPEKEGLEWVKDKIQNIYIFGIFEGETGQKAPWFLTPSITFPIAFLIVSAAFYVSIINGAISERGAQKTDELDEIILSYLLPDSNVDPQFVAAVAATAFALVSNLSF